jgi:hypothetical protein
MNDFAADTPPLTARDLRIFGITFAAAFAVTLGLIVPLIRRAHFAFWPWAIAAVFLLFALAAPEALRRFHTLWMWLGHRLGAIQSRIILSIVFFLIVTPLGWLMRLTRKSRGFDRGAATYRIPSTPRAAKTMERPF